MTKPRLSDVKAWYPMKDDSNQWAALYFADIDDAFIMVYPMKQDYKRKYFWGETAWQDARRYANDIYFKELYK